jgi:hypothetical protein
MLWGWAGPVIGTSLLPVGWRSVIMWRSISSGRPAITPGRWPRCYLAKYFLNDLIEFLFLFFIQQGLYLLKMFEREDVFLLR